MTDPLKRLAGANPVLLEEPEQEVAERELQRFRAGVETVRRMRTDSGAGAELPSAAPRHVVGAGLAAARSRRGADAGPVPAQPRRRMLAGAVAVACVAAVVLAVLAAAPGPSAPGPAPTLIARAYAAVLPGDRVVHEVVTSEWRGGSARPGGERLEGWYRPATGQAFGRIGGDEGGVRVVVRQDDTVLVASRDVTRLTGQQGLVVQDPPVPGFLAKNRRDFTAEFRRAYEAGELADAGAATFDGRPAHRFATKPAALDGIDGLVWFVDPVSGRPLGSVETIGAQILTRRLATYERLEPTPAALATLEP